MNRKKVQGLYIKKMYWYIRYKDPITGKWKGISTGLLGTEKNRSEAKIRRTEFLKELNEIKVAEVTSGTIREAFLRFKALNTNRSASTIATYDYFFSYLSTFFDTAQHCTIFNKVRSEEFIIWLSNNTTLKQNTKYGIQKNFIKFLNFLFEYDYLPKTFKLNKDVRIKPKVNEPIIFSDRDRDKIITNLSSLDKNDNFTLMIYFLLYSGLRPSDIINITVEQIDLKKMTIRFYSSKTDNWFVRPIHPKIKVSLKARIESVSEGRLFDYSEAKNMGKAFQRYLEKLGLNHKGYDLRTFRKDFISRSQEANVPVNVASTLVGHKNIKTTMTYYTKLSSPHLRKELKKLK